MEEARTEERFYDMMTARKLVSASLAVAATMALAACQTGGGPSEPPPAAAPKGVEGSWIDAQGTGLSTISAGKFQTVATDTGQKLADGSYRLTSQTSIEINGTSLIRQSPIAFNCLLVSINQPNCTSQAGQNFVLTRRS